jgi:phospholipid/cholesterol/gamma-HCH transport system substrate-binding protein
MRHSSVVGRLAAIVAVMLAAVAIAVVLLTGGGGYSVKADFADASQLVKGDYVQVSGRPVGKVTNIQLTGGGQARVTLHIDHSFAPLRQGTELTVRAASLSGVANRYVDLRLPPAGTAKYPQGSVIPTSATTSAVDLDEIFNTFGPRQRKALQAVLQGSASQYVGRDAQARLGWAYLDPSISSTTALFRELNRDTAGFTRFLVSTSHLVGDIAQRRDDLAGLVDHLATTTGAIARPSGALAAAVRELAPFMRRANTTFVNLRSTLDSLKPLVDESKPVAKRLQPLLATLRPFAQDARPTVHDLTNIVSRPGNANDLIELTRDAVPLANATVRDVKANGKTRPGAFPASTSALQGSIPSLAYARPYAVDLQGWFDDFSHSGVSDALGAASRASPVFSAFSPELSNGVLDLLPISNPALRSAAFSAVAKVGQYDRCPGSMERDQGDKSTPYDPFSGSNPNFNCDPTQTPFGP